MRRAAPPDFDRFVDGLDYPMFVVTTADGNARAGCLVGFATQASIDPPRILVCLSVKNHTQRVAQAASTLAVHLLTPHQRDIAALFGGTTGDHLDKFARCAWEPGPNGVPLLTESAGWTIGEILERIPLGDHVGYLIRPTSTRRHRPGPVLTFQQVRDLTPGHGA